MVGLPPQFWDYLAQTSDGLSLVGFLSGLVGYVQQKNSAGEAAVIDDYLELLRRRDHTELYDSVSQNRQILESLQAFMQKIGAETSDRITGELRKIVESLAVPARPTVSVRVSYPLCVATDRRDGERSFQIEFMVRNMTPGPANIGRAHCYLAIAGKPIPCSEGDLMRGCRLGRQNETRRLHGHTSITRWPDGDPTLVCLEAEVEQDDGAIRYYIPRVGTDHLVEFEADSEAGQRCMMKSHESRPFGEITLLHPSKGTANAWTVRDKAGDIFDIPENRLLPTGMARCLD